MGMFGNILSKIFQSKEAAAVMPIPSPLIANVPQQAAPSAQPTQTVDVNVVLNNMAKNSSEKLNWRESIVDLLKLLGLDSSLTARKELAQELHYTGDTNDSASMNMWLSKQVMTKLTENGGRLPPELRA